jgi:hypothetical protein
LDLRTYIRRVNQMDNGPIVVRGKRSPKKL